MKKHQRDSSGNAIKWADIPSGKRHNKKISVSKFLKKIFAVSAMSNASASIRAIRSSKTNNPVENLDKAKAIANIVLETHKIVLEAFSC